MVSGWPVNGKANVDPFDMSAFDVSDLPRRRGFAEK